MANKCIVTDRIKKSMQADFDRGMSLSEIARKYGVRYDLARKYVDNHKSAILDVPKVYANKAEFSRKWNEVRYALIMGLRMEWIDEWNETRARILAVKQ